MNNYGWKVFFSQFSIALMTYKINWSYNGTTEIVAKDVFTAKTILMNLSDEELSKDADETLSIDNVECIDNE
jgi:hypothetical protein